ncbi:MAG: Gfo/Idh/MocA family oxidoreductase [Planctomycetota bacterium]|nr:Gfo/Idh/MocA family oxidoreductase [Planctomycetota bacterium]
MERERGLKVAVVGVGHLGKAHARIYSETKGVELVGVVDIDSAVARAVADKLGTRAFYDHRDVLGMVDAVSIVVPTNKHYEIAKDFLEAGVHTFLEKPMTKTVEEAESLVRLAKEKGCILQIGHIERFNPAVIAVKELVKEPRFIECDRISKFSFRSLDIGVVLDMMIHDLDIVLAFVNSEPVEVEGVGIAVFGSYEDMASARIKFKNGCLAYLRVSRISNKSMRKIRVFQADSYLSIDYAERTAKVFRKKEAVFLKEDVATLPRRVSSLEDAQKYLFENLIEMREVPIAEDEEPLRLELESFIESVEEGKPPLVSGELALRTMRLAYRILQSIQENSYATPLRSDLCR